MFEFKSEHFNEWVSWYYRSEYDKIVNDFMNRLESFRRTWTIEPKNKEIYLMITTFSSLYVNPIFDLKDHLHLAWLLMNYNYMLYSLAHFNDIDLDYYLKTLLDNNQVVYKILLFANPMSQVPINYDILLNYNPYWTSAWIDTCSSYSECCRGTEEGQNQMEVHYNKVINSNYLCVSPLTYFLSSYISDNISREIKKTINRTIQNKWGHIEIINNPIPNKLLVIGKTDTISLGNPIHKYIRGHLLALKSRFHLTLALLNDINIEDDQQLKHTINEIYDDYFIFTMPTGRSFQEINYFEHILNNPQNLRNFDKFTNNTYAAVYFPTVGDCIETIYLSNLKLARVQFSSYGHPISSFGSKNNYYIASSDIDNINIQDNYTEQLLYLDGYGANTVIPEQEPLKPIESYKINLAWNFKKIRPYMLDLLNEIADKTDKPIEYVMHIGPCDGRPFHISHIREALKHVKNVTIIPSLLSGEEYNEIKKTSYMALDSYPWGGYTTIFEHLTRNVPVVTLIGPNAISRLPAAILKFYGFSELIATTREEYVNKTLQILNDDGYYQYLRQKINSLNIRQMMLDKNYDQRFCDLVYNITRPDKCSLNTCHTEPIQEEKQEQEQEEIHKMFFKIIDDLPIDDIIDDLPVDYDYVDIIDDYDRVEYNIVKEEIKEEIKEKIKEEPRKTKTIYFVKHGETNKVNDINMQLSPAGKLQAMNMKNVIKNLITDNSRILTSPLSCSIETALLSVPLEVPIIVTEMAAEVTLSINEVGLRKSELMAKYPRLTFMINEEEWWDTFENNNYNNGVIDKAIKDFEQRLVKLGDYIKNEDYSTLIIFTHDNIIFNFTQQQNVAPGNIIKVSY